ncbi:MAG: hypothetical protein ACJ735_04220 [Actinomycetes bacterium]
MLAGLAYGQLRHHSYDGQTTVIVYPVAGAPFSQQKTGNQLVDLSTEAQLVRSDAVARLAESKLAAMGYDQLTVAGLISRVAATVETNAQVLQITYAAGTPRRARDGADAFASAYLDYREALAKKVATDGLALITSQRKTLNHVRAIYQHQLRRARPGSALAEQLQATILVEDKSLIDLRTQEADIRDRSVLPGEVLSPATLPATPSSTSPAILAAFGFLFGLALGTATAVALERKAGTIRRAQSLPDEPPVLAVVPPARVAEPVLLRKPDHRSGEAYRLLYLAVDAALPVTGGRGQIIIVSSLTDPAPPVGVNLALAAAAAGRLTTYVNALPRNRAPRLPAVGVDLRGPGFAEAVLTGTDPMPTRLASTPRLSVLPAGADIARAAETYGGPRTERALDSLRRGADLVVIAAPPLTDPDGQALASIANAVVVVATIGLATFGQLDAALTEAGRVHANVLGVVAFHQPAGKLPARSEPRTVATTDKPPAPATSVPT